MASLLLYSTNPWISHEIATKYRKGKHFVWCSEHFDPFKAAAGTSAAAIAPSSSPRGIYEALKRDCDQEDTHSHLIKGYRKTFKRLAKEWWVDQSITEYERDEIISVVNSSSWKIWRPQLFLIPRQHIDSSNRLQSVKRNDRAAYGPEHQICDLDTTEFEIIEW